MLANATPRAARTRSVARLSVENRPVSRSVCPRAKWSIVARRTWFVATKTTQATSPATAIVGCLPQPKLRTMSTAPHAASPFSVWLQMLKLWMYHGYRIFSHSGMRAMPMSATSSGGKRSAAGMRNTFVVWYDWSRGARTPLYAAEFGPNGAHLTQPELPLHWVIAAPNPLHAQARGRRAIAGSYAP